MGGMTPQTLGDSPVMIHLYVEDVDAFARQAVAAGAKLIRPVRDEARGDRVCTLLDPLGHRWMIATHKRDVSLDAQRKLDPAWEITQPDEAKEAPDDRSAIAYLTVDDGIRAIDFYKKAFDASETLRFMDQSGRVGHATLRIGDSALFLSDEFPGVCSSPRTLGGSSVVIHFYSEDVDRIAQKAVENGAKVLIPVSNQPYGDRSGRLQDPFGHIWTVATHIEDVSPDQLRERGHSA